MGDLGGLGVRHHCYENVRVEIQILVWHDHDSLISGRGVLHDVGRDQSGAAVDDSVRARPSDQGGGDQRQDEGGFHFQLSNIDTTSGAMTVGDAPTDLNNLLHVSLLLFRAQADS